MDQSTGLNRIENYQKICRLCLKNDGYLLAIFKVDQFETDVPNRHFLQSHERRKNDDQMQFSSPNFNQPFNIHNKIIEFLPIKVGKNDGLPSNICHRCLYKIELCINFKQTCLHADATLRHRFSPSSPDEDRILSNNEDYIRNHHVVNHLQFEEFSLKNHKFLENHENVENIVTVVDPNVEYESDNDETAVEPNVGVQSNYQEEQKEMIVSNIRNQPQLSQQPSDIENDASGEINELKNVFMCQFCDQAFTTQELCYIHEQTNHDADTPFLCQECDMAFGDRVNYTAHLKSVHRNDKPFGCPECERSFGRRSDLRKHTIVHTGIKPFTCPLCMKSFSRNTNLTKHLRIHSGHKPHVCPQCPRTFISKGDLSRHMLIHSGVKPFSCSHCDQSFGRRDKLIRHEKRHIRPINDDGTDHNIPPHQEIGLLRQQLLENQYPNFEGLDAEIKQEIESDQEDNSENMIISLNPYNHDANEEEPMETEEKMLEAEYKSEKRDTSEEKDSSPEHVTGDDETGFAGFSAEEAKMAKSELLKQFSCNMCPKRFSSGEALRFHSNTHIRQRIHGCSSCSKTFMRKRELERHMSIHTSIKPFQCSSCPKKFSRKDKMLRHQRSHDEQKQFICAYCSATFTRKDNLAQHINSHMANDGLSLSLDGESIMLASSVNASDS